MNYRSCVIQTLLDVAVQGKSLSSALIHNQQSVASLQLPVYRQMVYGTLRFYPSLAVVLNSLLDKPLPRKHADVAMVIILGLYEIRYLKTPNHACVSESVNNVVSLGKKWARGLVNALLRRAIREKDQIDSRLKDDPVYRYSHPLWLYDMLRKAWPVQFPDILDNNNHQAPLTLRVNQRTDQRQNYLEELDRLGISAKPTRLAELGVHLTHSVPVESLPGFMQGRVSIQDEASQLVAELLDITAGLRVLDACAAPGGKSCHMLESCPDLHLTAIDRNPDRLPLLEDNLRRIGLSCRSFCADAGKPRSWWDGDPFDRILLDAPCSATGIIRRQPDIKLLRREADIDKLASQQQRLLDALWPLLNKGGVMLYTTCSVLPRENSLVAAAFLASHADARELPIDANWGLGVSIGRQLLPNKESHDGFYYARLQKC